MSTCEVSSSRSRKGLTGSSLSFVLLFYLLLGVIVVALTGNTGIIAFGDVPAEAKDVSDHCTTDAPGA